MPQLATRFERERIIAQALAALYGQQRVRLQQYLLSHPDLSQIPEIEWQRIEHETNEALRSELLLIYLMAARNTGISPLILPHSQIARNGIEFSTRRAAQLGASITANTKVGLGEAIREFHLEPKLALDRVPTAESVLDKHSRFRKTLIDLLGPGRAESIAITETTGAITRGESESIESAGRATGEGHREVSKTVVWHTREDARVCIHCQPLDGRRMDEWENFVSGRILEMILENGGPPAHPRCRCYTTFELPEHWRWN